MMFHVKCVVIIARANTMVSTLAMDVLDFLNVQFDVTVNMYANQNRMVSVWLIRHIAINVAHVD